MLRQRENPGIYWDENWKATLQFKINYTTWRNKSKGTHERRKTKKILRQDQTIQTKQHIPKQQKKILPAIWVGMHKDISTTKKAKQFKKTKIHLDSFRVKLRKYQVGKLQVMIAYMDTGLKNSLPSNNRLAIKMNGWLEESNMPEWVAKGKTTLIQKDPQKGNTSSNNYRPITYLLIMWKCSSSSSSCHAGSTDIPDPLSPLLPIVHRPRQVFRTTSRILT